LILTRRLGFPAKPHRLARAWNIIKTTRSSSPARATG
jgi:hypothetical protein